MYLLIHREDVELVPQFLFYSGQRELHQFSVTKVATAKIGSRALFIMTFKRKFAYNVISVYLPSSTIFIISLFLSKHLFSFLLHLHHLFIFSICSSPLHPTVVFQLQNQSSLRRLVLFILILIYLYRVNSIMNIVLCTFHIIHCTLCIRQLHQRVCFHLSPSRSSCLSSSQNDTHQRSFRISS